MAIVCGSAPTASMADNDPIRKPQTVIVVAGPVTGRSAPITDAMLLGARAAATRLNASGGLNGAPVAVEMADDGCSSETATATATALVARGVALVIGHPCTTAALAAAKIYAASGTLYFVTASRHPALTQPRPGSTVFRLSGRDDKQGEDAAAALKAAAKGGAIAIVHDRTQYARSIAEAAAAALVKAGAAAPVTATLIAGEKDFPLVTAKIKGAAAVFYAGFPLEAGLLFRQLRASRSDARLFVSDSIATPEFTATFGADAVGVAALLPRFAMTATSEDPRLSSAERTLAAARALAETAVIAFSATAARSKATDGKTIADQLAAVGAAGPEGPMTFDPSGDARRPSFDAHTWTGTSWQRLESSP